MRTVLFRGAAAVALSMVMLLSAGAHPAVAAAPATGTVLYAPAGKAVKDSYIVVLNQDKSLRSAVGATANRLAAGQQGRVGRVFDSALQGFEVSTDEAGARRLAADPAVAYVEQNSHFSPQDVQSNPPSWGLDRIDQRDYQRNFSYTYPTVASDIEVYVIDSGIQGSHIDFAQFRVHPGPSMVQGTPSDQDCNGHGTHVGGTIGGTNYGVAKGVILIPVKVFDCSGDTTTGIILAAVDWVTARHLPGDRGIVNMSLSGGPSTAVDDAVTRSMNDGLVYTVAAGNRTSTVSDACQLSPARVRRAITVASMGNTDLIDGFSNTGSCVDVYAPGSGIISASNVYNWVGVVMDGTSMASAHAAGVAAMLWSMHPSLNAAAITTLVRQTAFHGAGWNPGSKPDPALYIQAVTPSPLPFIDPEVASVGPLQLTAAGGVGPYTWSATGLPPNVKLSPSGVLSGSVWPGTFAVKVTATDAMGRSGTVTETWRQPVPCPRPAC